MADPGGGGVRGGGRVNKLRRTWAWGHDGVIGSGKCAKGLEKGLEIVLSNFAMIIDYTDTIFVHKYPF